MIYRFVIIGLMLVVIVPLCVIDSSAERFSTPKGNHNILEVVGGVEYALYPTILDSKPEISSPYRTENGEEFIVVETEDRRYAVVQVTLSDSGTLPPEAKKWPIMHGNQLHVDGNDFPYLALNGLHCEDSLKKVGSITWKSVKDISAEGRPDRASGSGFMAEDEDIVSVLVGDNRMVTRLGFTHPQMARLLFHVYNLIDREAAYGHLRRPNVPNFITKIFYNGLTIQIKAWGTKGYQESIFNDEIRGMMQFELWRDLSAKEMEYLKTRYSQLSAKQFQEMVQRITKIHVGEMVPYYVMRYGFYEGHTDFRADPIALAWLFGLKSLEGIDEALDGKMYEALVTHYISKNV